MSTVCAQWVGGPCGEVDSVTGCSAQKRALKCVSNQSTRAWHDTPPVAAASLKRSWNSEVKFWSDTLQVVKSRDLTPTESVMICMHNSELQIGFDPRHRSDDYPISTGQIRFK